MPALDEKAYAKFSLMLEELAPEVDGMKEVPQSFVKDMIDKHEQYGERMFVSPKQLQWLERLHEEFVGNTDHAQESNDPRSDRDMDDDIPF